VTRVPLALALAAVAAITAAAQPPTFRARVSRVRVDVLATDRGKPIVGLSAGDFEVLDEGAPQTIDSFGGEEEPLDVLFTFDRSNSVKGEPLRRLKEAANAVLDQLQPADRAGLLTFDHMISLQRPLTEDQAAIRTAIASMEAGGSTAILDAVHAALTLAEGGNRRTMILLFSDGWDNLSWVPQADVEEIARESEAVLYAVAFKPSRLGNQPLSTGPDEGLLNELTSATGGRVVLADTTDRLKQAFLTLFVEMRSRYVLTFSPARETPGWHTLSVRLKHRSGKVTARQGYLVRASETR
jgi:VWFA-related protein